MTVPLSSSDALRKYAPFSTILGRQNSDAGGFGLRLTENARDLRTDVADD
jgi:hypothetical protein